MTGEERLEQFRARLLAAWLTHATPEAPVDAASVVSLLRQGYSLERAYVAYREVEDRRARQLMARILERFRTFLRRS